ncbi:MAG: MBL fold metallo-hydrolase [Proteobacteria bacterium]|nr:MBL fold metallo-hydrolase [Pseudomonadota bacterium]
MSKANFSDDFKREGLEIVTVEHPLIIKEQAMISGEIKRHTDYESGPTPLRVGPEDRNLADEMPGEQALIYKLDGKGLVVLTACCHAGIVNTVRHAQEVTGVEDVHAILGGFHLTGASDERVEKTVDDLAALDPDFIVPMHCTGLAAIDVLKTRLGDRILCNSVGTQYQFE